MPIIEAGFINDDGKSDPNALVKFGPTIRVFVGHLKAASSSNSVTDEFVHALIDTGATESCIDISLAQKLELPAVDRITISGVGGAKIHDVYMAQIHIPQLNFTQYGKFAGVQLAGGGQQHHALLGRTFLQGTIMIYDGIRGQVTVTTS